MQIWTQFFLYNNLRLLPPARPSSIHDISALLVSWTTFTTNFVDEKFIVKELEIMDPFYISFISIFPVVLKIQPFGIFIGWAVTCIRLFHHCGRFLFYAQNFKLISLLFCLSLCVDSLQNDVGQCMPCIKMNRTVNTSIHTTYLCITIYIIESWQHPAALSHMMVSIVKVITAAYLRFIMLMCGAQCRCPLVACSTSTQHSSSKNSFAVIWFTF